jgi:hypothetical protein
MIPFCHQEVVNGPPSHTSAGRPVHWADYPKLVYLQTSTFDWLLDDSVGYKRLVLEEKEAKTASNDLIISVRVSDSKSKDQIAEMLSRLVDLAGELGGSLYYLRAKIQGAVDL